MTKAEFLFDFGSPNAYLSGRVIAGIEARTGVTFDYVPVLLGGIFKATGNKSPMEAYGHVAPKFAYDQLETQRFITRHGLVDFSFNPHFPVNTVMLMRGAVFAKREGFLPAYFDVAAAAMWEKGLKMDDAEIFAQALTDGGLDGAAILAATQDQAIKDELKSSTEAAVARGVFGIPTFFVGDEMFFGKDKLRDVEDEITTQS
ncbi:MAG: 2-hydroxychromene-2-carboxylate isomerase [Alphaproteobacteria bacterium]